MLVQVNTDNNIDGSDEVVRKVEGWLATSLDRYGDRITRVQVHLGDENSDKKSGSNDMKCTLEARIAGLRPIAVTDHAQTLEQAVVGAIDKFERALDTTLGKLEDR